VLKGILRPDDAELAVHHGVAAIAVSNHGARQLDGVPATVYKLTFCYFAVIFIILMLSNLLL